MRSPFQFLDAYGRQDRDRFFGRDKEISDLYEMVFKTPLVLVYGLSGTGKTSLVQCGLANRFDRADWYPMFIRRGEDINLSLGARLAKLAPDGNDLETKIKAYQEAGVPSSDLSKELAGEVVACLDSFYDEYLRPPYLIFDQFEETFILGDRKEEEVFAHIVRAIVDSGLPVKMLLIMREEYLGHLNHFERIVPNIYDYRFRVEQMNDLKVANVIVHSCKHFSIGLEGLESPEKVDAFLRDEKRELDTPPAVETIIENIRGEEEKEEGVVKKNAAHIQLPYLQVYLDGLYRQVLAEKAWKTIETEFAARYPEIPSRPVVDWLRDSDTLETAGRSEGPLTADAKTFCLNRLEQHGILTRNKENHLVRVDFPSLEFTTAKVEAFGEIKEVLGGFLESQSEQIREQLLRDYQERKISAGVLALIGNYLDQASIRTSQIQLPGLISRDQFESCVELLEEAKVLLRQDDDLYQPVARNREKLDKQAPRLLEKLEKRFQESSGLAVQNFLNSFVTLEGTKKPLARTDIASAHLSDEQLELCLGQLERARVLRRSDDHYEVAHDALAKRIRDKRSQDQVAVLEITKIVRDRYNAFQLAKRDDNQKIDPKNYLTDQELRLIDEYRRRLREEKLLKQEEWEFIAQSEAQSRRRQRMRILAIIGAMVLLSGIFLGIGFYTKALDEAGRLKAALCIAYQEHAQTLQASKNYFAAIETYQKALAEGCDPAALQSEIDAVVEIICNECGDLVMQGEKWMDERNFSLALEKYTEAREIILAKERLGASQAEYFQNCVTLATLDSAKITMKINSARRNLIDAKVPQFNALIARGDFFFNRGTPYHWDALRYYRAADQIANQLMLNEIQREEVQKRIARVTPGLLREDLRHLTMVGATMMESDAVAKEKYAREVYSKADSIRKDILLREN